jgi:sugar phosphate isomerase/epimerase
MKLSVSSLLYIKYPRREAFASLQRLGVAYVDLWDHPGFGSHVSVTADDSVAVRADLADYGLKPSAVSLYSAEVEKIKAGIDYAAKIGAPLVVVGFSGGNEEQFADFLRPLAETARNHGVALGVENHVDTPADSIDRLNRLSELVPGLAYCYAPPHSVYMGEDQQRNITALGERLGMFYLWDCPWGATGLTWFRKNWNQLPEEQFPGRGKLTPQFPALLETLKAIRFAGSLNLLVHGSADWPVAKIESHVRTSLRFLGLPVRTLD